MPRSKKIFGKARVLEDWEVRAIINAFERPHHRLITAIGAYTGERGGAIVQLNVNNAYKSTHPITLQPTVRFPAEIRKGSPCGKREARFVPIALDLEKYLLGYKPPSRGYLFPGRAPETHYQLGSYNKALKRAIERANLEGRITSHSLRRTAITKLHEMGVPLADLQEVTGHKTLDSLRRYIQIPEKRKREIVNMLEY